tara:strand:+ start:1311 stop:1826 length:516 start_codon:yes stop_codon:yes gene_type:complete
MIASLLSRINIEVWKDIPEFEGLYQVSNLGNVRSLNFNKTKKVKLLKKGLNTNGRYRVGLSKNGKSQGNCKIHQLSAMAFLNHKPCGHKMVVDHIDNNKLNDKLYNLQVITNRENVSKDKKGGTSKYIGVYKEKNKFRAAIRIDGKIKYLGLFTDEKEAAQVYQNELNKIK